jgi:transglutaminase-like putative cysteine protease
MCYFMAQDTATPKATCSLPCCAQTASRPGLCYQRLSLHGNGAPFCLHGLNAVHLADIGWLRLDGRGNKPGVNARFEPPKEFLAFRVDAPGEYDLPEIWPEPLPCVIQALEAHTDYAELLADLPDIAPAPMRTTP